jgi:hypothetical protein
MRLQPRAPTGRGGSDLYTGRAYWKHRRLCCDAEQVTDETQNKLAVIAYAALWSVADGQAPAAPASYDSDMPRASIALSPAIIMVRCRPGQSTTQVLTIINHTANEVSFNLATEDVVVREGKRSYLPAGQIPNGIAVNAVASPASVSVKAGEEASVQVTFTLPPETGQRAVVTFFRGGIVPGANGAIGLGASLGTLITFNVSSNYAVDAGPVLSSLQTPTANVILSQELHNSGSEPVMPKGVIVVLNESGRRVAKAAFISQRLLPGERLLFAAANPAQLGPGHYRTVSSFEFEGKVITSAGEFTVPD